jgi:hypothetical protein
MKEYQPNERYQHLFIVVRIDDLQGGDVEDRFSPVAIYQSQSKAEVEAERLTDVNSAKNSRYIVRVSRLKD